MTASKIKRKKDTVNIWKKISKYLPLCIIISFSAVFFIFVFQYGFNPFSFLSDVFFKKNEIIYNSYTVSLDKGIPKKYVDQIKESLSKIEFNEVKRFVFVDENPDILISTSTNKENSIFFEKLIPVSHLYSLVYNVDLENLDDYNIFLVGDEYKEYVEDVLNKDVLILNEYSELITKLSESDSNIGFVLFDDIVPDLKILSVNSKYFLDDTSACLPIYFSAKLNVEDTYILSVLKRNLHLDIDNSIFNEDLLAKINMTGVTAISRDLASKIDSLKNYDYPAEALGDFLADADLTHTSNEVSFLNGCVAQGGMRFCSKPEYIDVLTRSGIDIVELTGNHNNDYGATANAESIKKYTDLGMRYFGGGLNTDDAAKILYEEVNGNTIAFIGYNYYDTMLGTGALAGVSRAGANSYSDEKMKSNIEEARKKAGIVIVDFQFQECWSYPDGDVIYPICYKPLSSPDQKGTFRKAADYGADIVMGTQAHQPQTYELYKDSVIFYGLGNLYFDQDVWIGTRQAMILTHYIYDGKYIQTKITPIYMDSTLQPDFATKEQADLLLKLLKEAR